MMVLGIFKLNPILLRIKGVVRDCALLRVFKESVVAANRYAIVGRK